MSNILRSVFLVLLVLGLMFLLLPKTPADASFSAVCYVTDTTLPGIRLQADTDGGATFYVQTPNGDGRFLQIRSGGGHWEIHTMTSLPADNSLELDADGYPVVHQD